MQLEQNPRILFVRTAEIYLVLRERERFCWGKSMELSSGDAKPAAWLGNARRASEPSWGLHKQKLAVRSRSTLKLWWEGNPYLCRHMRAKRKN